MTARERAEKAMENAAGGWRSFPAMTAAVEAAILAAEAEAYDRAESVAEQERRAYEASAKGCDAAGNYRGGSNDTSAALACERVAVLIRSLAKKGGEG